MGVLNYLLNGMILQVPLYLTLPESLEEQIAETSKRLEYLELSRLKGSNHLDLVLSNC